MRVFGWKLICAPSFLDFIWALTNKCVIKNQMNEYVEFKLDMGRWIGRQFEIEPKAEIKQANSPRPGFKLPHL